MIAHPSTYIEPEIAAALRNVAHEAELLKQIHPVQQAIIYEHRWLQLFVPGEYHGLQLPLPDALRLEEALAWVDGSVGWTVTLCAGAAWFIGFFDPETTAQIFNGPGVCIAGSGKASGIAKKIPGGYEVSGVWDYASGAAMATAFTANCMIEDNGQLLRDARGIPLVMPFIFLKDEVTVHHNWKPMGMIATGSNSFEVNHLTVDNKRAFIIDKDHVVRKAPIYEYPFLQFAELTLAVNSSGMAMRFIDLCTAITGQNESRLPVLLLNEAVSDIDKARTAFYEVATASWEQCSTNRAIMPDLLLQISTASKQLAVTSRKVVDELYPYCGMAAANPDTELNRVWRNLHTASQHSMFNK